MGGSLREKFRLDPHSGGGSRKVFWPSSGTLLGSRPVPEVLIGVYSVLTPMGVNKRNISKYLELPKKDTLIKCSDSGREPSRVPELGQKTFRLPPPEWGSNRNFSRRLPPIMYKGGIMYTTQKRKFFRLWAGFRKVVGRISFFGSRTLYPLCTLWGVACGKSSD